MNNYKDLNDYEVIYMIGEKSDDATNLLFDKYKPVINKLASQYYQYGKDLGLEYQDFVQEGYLGLSIAIKRYNDNKHCLFYTYVLVCIKSRMSNLLKRNRTKKNYALNNSISIYSPIDYDNDKELIECLEDSKALHPEKEMDNKILIDKIKTFLYDLDIEKASVFELRYNGFTNREIAKLLDLHIRMVSYIIIFIKRKLEFYR